MLQNIITKIKKSLYDDEGLFQKGRLTLSPRVISPIPEPQPVKQAPITLDTVKSGIKNSLAQAGQAVRRYVDPMQSGTEGFWGTPAAQGLGKAQEILESTRELPKLTAISSAIDRAPLHPLIKFPASLVAGVGEGIVNAPIRAWETGARIGYDVPRMVRGEKKLTLPQAVYDVAPLATGMLDVSGLRAAKGIGSQAVKQAVKLSLKDAIKKGAAEGLAYGAARGFTEAASKPEIERTQSLSSTILPTAVSGMGGAILGAGIAGVGGVFGKVANIYRKYHPKASPQEVNRETASFLARDAVNAVKPITVKHTVPVIKDGKVIDTFELSRTYKDGKVPEWIGEARRSIGLPKEGGNINDLPMGLSVRPITPKERAKIKIRVKQAAGNFPKPPQNTPNLPTAEANITAKTAGIEGGARGAQVAPEYRGYNERERGFISSVKEAENIKKAIRKAVHGTYQPKGNVELMGEARALLTEGATIDFRNTKDLDKKIAATIQEALNAQRSGNHELAANLFNNLAEHGTELGRSVQAFSLLPKMSPEAISLSIAGRIKRYNQTALRKIPELTGEQQKMIADKIAAIELLKGRDKDIATHELYEMVNSFIPSSIADKALAVWKAGLLTSLRTHERNFVGNAIHGAMEIAKDIPATITDVGISKITGQRTKTFTTKGVSEFSSANTRQQVKDILTRGFDPTEQIKKFDHKTITWGNNPVEQALKRYTDIVFRTLGSSDKPFYNAAFARSLYDQAGAIAINEGKRGDAGFIEQLVKHPTEQMVKTALNDANIATFKNKNAATSVANAIKRAMQSETFGPIGREFGKIVGEITMPFTGVPSSILGQVINYSPAGLLKGIYAVGNVSLNKVPELQRKAVEELGRGIIGTGIYGLGAYLFNKGLITGQPKDEAEQRLWDAQNKPRNSIFIGGKWRSLNSIGPEAIVFLAGAKLQEELNNPEGSMANYGMSLAKDYLDQSFVQGLKAPINAITDPKRYAKWYAGQLASSVIPNIVKDAAKSSDPYMREANTIGDYVATNLPIIRSSMTPVRDILGNIRPQEPTGVGAFVDLFSSKTPIKNTVFAELERLYNEGENAIPGKLQKTQTIGGVKTTLSPEELDRLEETIGADAMQSLQSLISSAAYQALSDVEKADAIQSLLSQVRKVARATFVPNADTLETNNVRSQQAPYLLINKKTGSVKQVDLSTPIEPPTLTGIDSVDKELISQYKSSLNERKRDAIALYQNGQISFDQLKSIVSGVSASSSRYSKAKKLKVINPPKAKKIIYRIAKTSIKPIKIRVKKIPVALPRRKTKKLRIKLIKRKG